MRALGDRDRAAAMIRIAAQLERTNELESDPLVQIGRIAFNEENDPAVRLAASRELAKYVYRQLPPESAPEASRKALIEGDAITVSWETARPAPALEVLDK